MACCLTAPSHYLNQCWLIATKVYWYSSEDNFTTDTPAISCQNYSENYSFKISFKSPRGQWVNILRWPPICRRHFQIQFYEWHFFNLTQIAHTFMSKGQINNKPTLVVIYALDEWQPSLLTHWHVTQSSWANRPMRCRGRPVSWWRHQMETFSASLANLCGEFTGHRWIPSTKAW